MARLRYNGLSAALGASLTNSATSVTFAAGLTHSNGTDVPTITGSDYIPLAILDSSGHLSEVVWLTAYTAAATTGTIARGKEGTSGVSHSAGDAVAQGPLAADFPTLSYLGKNAIGATGWGLIAGQAGLFKKITTTGAAQLLSVDAYLRMGSDGPFGLGFALFADDGSGVPSRVLAYNQLPAQAILLNASSGEVSSSGVGRWFSMPLAYDLAASSDYWVGPWSNSGSAVVECAYDSGGSDRTYQTANAWIADWGRYTPGTTTRDYSIRARILSL